MENKNIAKQRLSAKQTRRLSAKLTLFFCVCSASVFGFGFALLVLTAQVQAATLLISPSSRSLSEGESFSIDVLLSSPDQTVNAAEGAIFFPPNKLRVIAVSDSGSIFNLWVKEPSFSNSLGAIDFSGLILNPGFVGQIGKMFTVSFQARAQGSAPIAFMSGAVLANDGRGTNILSGFKSANYFVVSPIAIPPVKTAPQKKEPVKTPEKLEDFPAPPETPALPEAPETDQAGPLLYVIEPPNTVNQLINLSILLTLLVIIWYLWRRSSMTAGELKTVEMEMHNRLDMLREDIKRRVQHLEELDSRQGLTGEEKGILQELKEELVKTAWPNR